MWSFVSFSLVVLLYGYYVVLTGGQYHHDDHDHDHPFILSGFALDYLLSRHGGGDRYL